mgnify:FL=1
MFLKKLNKQNTNEFLNNPNELIEYMSKFKCFLNKKHFLEIDLHNDLILKNNDELEQQYRELLYTALMNTKFDRYDNRVSDNDEFVFFISGLKQVYKINTTKKDNTAIMTLEFVKLLK